MCKAYALLALDLDGTLLTSDLTISQHTSKALKAASDVGVVVTVATGRMYISALPYAMELAIDVPLIAHNGGMIKSTFSGEVIYYKPLPSDCMQELVWNLREEGLTFMAYYDSAIYVEKEFIPDNTGYVKFTRAHATIVDDMIYELPGPPLSIGVRGEAVQVDKVYKDLQTKFGEDLHLVKSFPTLLEIHHPLASKGHALEELALHLSITPNDIIAVGDNLNDLEMLQVAGLGVAMGNSPQEVKDVADYVAPSNDEDGVAHVVEKFILSRGSKRDMGKEGEEARFPQEGNIIA